jgi:hypothetical protein
MALCETLYNRAVDTWSDIRWAHESNISLGEESITDYHLLRIQQAHSDVVRTHKFSHFRECRMSGADWEWWFVNESGRGLGVRIQAKKIDYATGRFPRLGHSCWGTRQVDRLINSSVADDVMPLYCLYASRPEESTMLNCECGVALSTSFARGCSFQSPLGLLTVYRGRPRVAPNSSRQQSGQNTKSPPTPSDSARQSSSAFSSR